MPHKRLKIRVRGIVQGVGFRPFVYNLAERLKLSGSVLNNKLGVDIEIEGTGSRCDRFLDALKREAPPLARIADINIDEIEIQNESKFRILHSELGGDDIGLISPDNDLCPNCEKEMLDPNDRRYRYPFINCTDCGPRYTLIKKTPYDRPFTSMSVFKMCGECLSEYENPRDRRFHAQPNACPVCGPQVELLDFSGNKIESDDPLQETAKLLADGKIVAIKGIGGYHLACDATGEEIVSELRNRKLRRDKPLAIMSKDVETVRGYALVSDEEERLLQAREKPIVLLAKKENGIIAPAVAGSFAEYGVFLPYTPIQRLLFSYDKIPPALVMTSGNLSDEPIIFDESELIERLGGIADYYLVNNRPIVWRCDDSVTRIFNGSISIIRRSRGWVPAPIFVEKKLPPLIACGGDLKSVFSIGKGNTIFPGPHIGDLEHAEAFNSFKGSIEHFKSVFEITPELAAVDMHPGYFSSAYGRSLGLPVIEVQHHHAHIASAMLENRLEGETIGLALDGTGYGPDGTIWGGEVLKCGYSSFERLFHFRAFPLPGGDKAAKEPWRSSVSIMENFIGQGSSMKLGNMVDEVGEESINKIGAVLKAGINSPLTSSAGRLFDAVASILSVSYFNNFEGQAPILLEAMADFSEEGTLGYEISAGGEIDFSEAISSIVSRAGIERERPKLAAMFHNTVAAALFECCEKLRKDTGVKNVCFGGGAFQNQFLLKRASALLERGGFATYYPKQMPINDGGLSVGQIAVAMGAL